MFEGISTFSLILYMIIFLLIAILVTVIVILVHSGIFQNIVVGTGKPPIGQTIIAYKFQKGPYNEAGQVFTEAAIISPKNRALGIYYDDPEKVLLISRSINVWDMYIYVIVMLCWLIYNGIYVYYFIKIEILFTSHFSFIRYFNHYDVKYLYHKFKLQYLEQGFGVREVNFPTPGLAPDS